uniref:TIR domain-containing protein n=1 Tax=Electrophorus electricus TaxID=8005 RepID=A0A4W4DXM7_ELEEL
FWFLSWECDFGPVHSPVLLYTCCSWKSIPCDITLSNTSVYLDCSRRKLNIVPQICLWNTTHLNLSNNKIRIVTKNSFCNLPNVTFINLKGNVIQNVIDKDKLFFSGLDRLQVLLLDSNRITTVPTDVPPGLQCLSLNGNNIKKVGISDFAKMKNITEFNLSNNCYHERRCQGSLNIQNGTFSDLNNLTNLSLLENRLQKIPPYLPKSLLKLYLHLNMIEHVEESKLKHLTKLRILDLSGNCPICYNAPFPCSPCKTKNNAMQIDAQAFCHLSQLEELRLSGNSLQSLNPSWFKNLASLKYLYLSFNFLISEIESGGFFSVLPHVEVIDLSYNNPLQTFSRRLKLSEGFSQLTSLKTLHLEGYVFYTLCERDLKPLFSLKNLSVLNLGVNFVQQINLSLFENFQNLSVISLIENRLTFTGMKASKQDGICISDEDSEEEHHRPNPYIHRDTDFRYYPPFIKPECLATGTVLDLSRNNIYHISSEGFQAVGNITCLNLSNNVISSFFNGTEFIQFSKLKYLDLSYNRVYLCLKSAFSELKELEVLDLSHNKHYFEIAGVSHTLEFLNNLEHLKVLNLSWNEINTLSNKTLNSSSLNELQFQGNRLDIMWKKDKGFKRIFTFLTNLTHLDISLNKLKQIPNDILSYFPPNLIYLNMNRNQLACFYFENLQSLPNLEILDLSKNKLHFTNERLSVQTSSLKILDLSHNMISTLGVNFLRNATSLWTLDLSFNRLEMISETMLRLYNGNYIKTLYLENNPFSCTCDLLDFVLWLESSEVVIPHLATGVLCNLPVSNKGQPMINHDLKDACNDDRTAQILYIFSTTLILVTMFAAITLHQFYWDVSYVIMLCKAKLRSHNLKITECIYDAFVMYDTKDPWASDWVLNHLRVELEDRGERVRPLCLEERDWTPGSSILENLNQSVRWSRKTVFVLTEGFVVSAIFKVAAYLAQQRLLEEGMDVMVLILLQPVLKHSRILQLRRCLCGNSVLEWPRNPSAEIWFWQSLRNAIRHDNQGMQSKMFNNYFNS